VVIFRNGTPVADLAPRKSRSRLKTDPALRRIKIKYDPTETLSEAEWPAAMWRGL